MSVEKPGIAVPSAETPVIVVPLSFNTEPEAIESRTHCNAIGMRVDEHRIAAIYPVCLRKVTFRPVFADTGTGWLKRAICQPESAA